jgi:hypothetical protein
MRPRRTWLMYLAVRDSGGIFAFVWLVILMRDINQIEGRRICTVEQLVVVMLFGLAAHVFLTFDGVSLGCRVASLRTSRAISSG